MQFYSQRLDGWCNPADVFVMLFTSASNHFWLDREHHSSAKYSVIGSGEPTDISNWDALDAFLKAQQTEFGSVELPFDFRPGLVGFINYEASEFAFLNVSQAVVFDHLKRKMYFIGLFESDAGFISWVHAALLRLSLAGGQEAAYRHRSVKSGSVSKPQLRHSSSQYLQLIEDSQARIALGDIYQICLTNSIEMKHDVDELVIFLKLRISNPAPYSSFIRLGNQTLVSSSPEQFIVLNRSGRVSTKPIKGTRPRSQDLAEDAALASQLKNDPKERAENLMIVDLMRNDIGRVSLPDSIQVENLFAIESYATVHQLVSTVSAQLAIGENVVSLLKSTFPGGSMTGAPKQKAQEIIRQYEGAPRGVYSGISGFIGFDGSAEFGMIIRSLIFDSDTVTLGIGGGITSDSDPLAELAETKLKAQALLAVLGAQDPWV